MPGGVNPSVPSWEKGDPIKADQLNELAQMLMRLSQAGRAGGANMTINGAGVFVQPCPDVPGNLFSNSTGTTVPAYGIMLDDGAQANGAFPLPNVKQPDAYGCQRNFLINDSLPVPSGSNGLSQSPGDNGYYIIAYDSNDGTPAKNESWGPRSGTYLAKKNTGGFIVQGIWDSTNHLMLAKSKPMEIVRGTIGADAAPDTSSTLTIFTGPYGSETTTSQTISNVRNATDCTIKSGSGAKVHTAMFDWTIGAGGGWQFVIGRTV